MSRIWPLPSRDALDSWSYRALHLERRIRLTRCCPDRYARGILFGKMVLELGDSSIVRNETTGLQCEVEFKTKVRLGSSWVGSSQLQY